MNGDRVQLVERASGTWSMHVYLRGELVVTRAGIQTFDEARRRGEAQLVMYGKMPIRVQAFKKDSGRKAGQQNRAGARGPLARADTTEGSRTERQCEP